MKKETKTYTFEFTEKEYFDLMRVAYLADWMANAICEPGDKEDVGIKRIRNKIFLEAAETKFEDFVDFDSEDEQAYPSFALDDEKSIRALRDRYNEKTFWEEVFDKLVDRDIANDLKKMSAKEREKIVKYDFIERITFEEPYRVFWGTELGKYGIERFGITKEK